MSEQKKVHHLSKEFKPMLEDGLIDEKGYYTKKYFEGLESKETDFGTQKKNEENTFSVSQVKQMMDEMKADIMRSIPSNSTQSNYPTQQPIKVDILDNIPELKDWVIKPREYRLCNNEKPLWREIQRQHTEQRDLQYLDRQSGKTFTMRYSSNQSSFFIEKQSINPNDVLVPRIAFEYGTLHLDVNYTRLQQFLHIHKDNIANGGSLFEEFDADKVSRKDIETRKLKNKAENLIDTVGKATNRAVASLESAGYIESWSDGEVEKAIWIFAEQNPRKYIEYCEDPSTKVKGVIKTALSKGDLVYKNYKFYDNKMEKLVDVQRDKDEIEEMATYLMSGEGRGLYEYLLNKN